MMAFQGVDAFLFFVIFARGLISSRPVRLSRFTFYTLLSIHHVSSYFLLLHCVRWPVLCGMLLQPRQRWQRLTRAWGDREAPTRRANIRVCLYIILGVEFGSPFPSVILGSACMPSCFIFNRFSLPFLLLTHQQVQLSAARQTTAI